MTTPVSDVEFDPYRSAQTDRIKTQIEEVRLQVRGYEKHFQTRKRKRKPQDEAIFRETLSALICDLEKGLNMMEVAAITGHRDLRMLQRYTHLKAEDLAVKLG